MKKLISVILLLALLLSCAFAENTDGGWNICESSAIPESALSAFNLAIAARTEESYEPVVLLGSQIVNGTNYCMLCRVKAINSDAKPRWAVVYYYESLDGEAEISMIQEMELGLWADYYELTGSSDLVISSPLLTSDSLLDSQRYEDGTMNEMYMLLGGYTFVNVIRVPAGEFGTFSGYDEGAFLTGSYDGIRKLTPETFSSVCGYPASRYSFESGYEEDTTVCDALFIYTESQSFCIVCVFDSDAYCGYTDLDSAELQGFASKLYASLTLEETAD